MTNTDTYSGSAKGLKISQARALRELRSHGMDMESVNEFFADMGVHEFYSASAVLEWLGY